MATIVKVIEVIAQSEKSWDDAVKNALDEVAKTVDDVKEIWVSGMKAIVEDGRIAEYRLTAKVSFVVKGLESSSVQLRELDVDRTQSADLVEVKQFAQPGAEQGRGIISAQREVAVVRTARVQGSPRVADAEQKLEHAVGGGAIQLSEGRCRDFQTDVGGVVEKTNAGAGRHYSSPVREAVR
jgi:dodecin